MRLVLQTATFQPLPRPRGRYLCPMELDLTTPAQPPRTADMVSRYMTLTKDVMPRLARTTHSDWPVRNDHCFQRIVLDTICGGVWYDHLHRPAYKNLTFQQAERAVWLCDKIIAGDVNLAVLNAQSLVWRGKAGPAKLLGQDGAARSRSWSGTVQGTRSTISDPGF